MLVPQEEYDILVTDIFFCAVYLDGCLTYKGPLLSIHTEQIASIWEPSPSSAYSSSITALAYSS